MFEDWALLGTVLGLLALITGAGQWLRYQDWLDLDQATVKAFNNRVYFWWFFSVVLGLAFFYPNITVFLFALLSLGALREFITLTPTRAGDHRALFWMFGLFTPAQFILVATNTYAIFSIMIPVYAFLFIAVRVAITGDFERFLERVGKIQFGLLICVYFLSFAPALLFLKRPEMEEDSINARLLFFFITMVLLSELLQFFCSRLFGKHSIVETIDDSRTWEGGLGGAVGTAIVGMFLYWATPFNTWWHAGAMSFLIAVTSSAGSLTMAAIKRDRGHDTPEILIESRGGILNRVDAICFSAPVFYHVTSYYLSKI